VGDYTFELALFNSSEKKLMSNILKVPTGLRVDYEKSLELTGCPKGPRNLEQIDQKQKKLRNFKFGS
jgi:hypothetical protein